MLLVLGRPGSGCTSFLKTIANETDGFSDVKGTISYDGITPKVMHKQFKGDVAYLPEGEFHSSWFVSFFRAPTDPSFAFLQMTPTCLS